MTFDPNVPNASASPGLFPTQNNTNFARLKAIIEADHVFNDTTQDTDGVHKKVVLITHALAVPGDLPTGTNALLYAWFDALGQVQLRFYNGNNDFQLTPPGVVTPLSIVGSISVGNMGVANIYLDPGFNYIGTVWGTVKGQASFSCYTVIRAGANSLKLINSNTQTTVAPTIQFSGNDLQIKNSVVLTQILDWSIIINRIE